MIFRRSKRFSGGAGRLGVALGAVLAGLHCVSADAGLISEIDLGGPAGRAVEFSQLDPGTAHTLVVLDANAFRASSFGVVTQVVGLPAGVGTNGVAMISDSAWPGAPWRTTPLALLPSGSATPATGLDFAFSRLLVLLEGASAVQRFDRPMTDAAPSAYDASAVVDWVLLGSGDLAPFYQANGHDIAGINAALGIDLLSRVVDKDAGRVAGRTSAIGQAMDLDTFYVGDPDANDRFLVSPTQEFRYTPGVSNPLLREVPEPGTLGAVALGLAIVVRRRR